MLPGASQLLGKVTQTDYGTGSGAGPISSKVAAAEASKADASNRSSTLPPAYDTLPDLLGKIEARSTSEEGTTSSSFARAKASVADSSVSLPALGEDAALGVGAGERLTPTERAAAKAAQKLSKPALSPGHASEPTSSVKVPSSDASASVVDSGVSVTESASGSFADVIGDAQDAASASSVSSPFVDPVEAAPGVNDIVASEGQFSAADSTTGLTAIARLIGKGDYDTDALPAKDIVDDSVYRKPDFSNTSRSVEHTAKPPSRGWFSSWGGVARSGEGNSAAITEADALRSELESQAKWDAVRIQEAVRAQNIEDKKIAAKDASLAEKKHREELEKTRESAITEAKRMLAVRTREVEEATALRRDKELADMLSKKEAELRDSIELQFLDREREMAAEREKSLIEAKAAVTTLRDQFGLLLENSMAAQSAAKTTSSAFSLGEAIDTNQPFSKQLSNIAGRTDLGALIASSIPEAVSQSGVPTFDELKESFASVSTHGRNAALVPDDSMGSMWGHFLASIASKLKIRVADPVGRGPPSSWPAPETDEERLGRAETLLENGDLAGATAVLESLSSKLSADVVSDWLTAAKARVAADQAAQVLLADAIISQVSLAQPHAEPPTSS